MIKNKHLPHNITDNRIDITFCGKGKCKCPAVSMDVNNDNVIIGGEDEGYTKVPKEDFKEFVAGIINGIPNESLAIKLKAVKDKVILGDDSDGYTEFTHEEFKLFVDEIRNGTFDTILG
tara:strand:+ start:184 stop:540 length:357 start_codon:yes stop_codon:yes gene_type:complete